MLDFVKIIERNPKKDTVEISPKFLINKSTDLMIRGSDFYAIYDESTGFWSTDEQRAISLIDDMTRTYYNEHKDSYNAVVRTNYIWDSDSGFIDKWHKYCQRQLRDNYVTLDEKLIFANDDPKKEDYASKKLPYPLTPGECPSYDKIMSTLYSPEERHKIEWAIGSIVTGDSKHIQKFLVLYGSAGTGKSTVLNIIQQLFEGYYSVFDARALGSANNSFALEAFKSNPLVAIQHDGDLSKIEDNTRLNSLVSHETMMVNEKFKTAYANQFKSFLFMGTNKPVKITDAKSGIIRRLIDVSPTGEKIKPSEYRTLTSQIKFELGAIACHCRDVYLEDPNYYDDYIPMSMIGATNDFYTFMVSNYTEFKREDSVSLNIAWEKYKTFCDDAKIQYPFSRRVFKEELKNYFSDFIELGEVNGRIVEGQYRGFLYSKFKVPELKKLDKQVEKETLPQWMNLSSDKSIFDTDYSDCIAQYAKADGTPKKAWDEVSTKLGELDTTKLHYVRMPENHIVIDFDISSNGEKDAELNIKEASKWPKTYAEFSKSGKGIHLHYIYDGDASKLSRIYDDHIEIKVFTGKSSLRRKLTKCNNVPIAHISSGLPLRGDTKVIDFDGVQSEKGIRTLIMRNLNKEYHPGTKPSIDFIKKILDDAYDSGLKYDVSDMRNAVLSFGANSTHHAPYCLDRIAEMKFKSEETREILADNGGKLVFYDIEVFPNLFIVNWKFEGEDSKIVRMINPTPSDIENLVQNKLVGFNNRRYDNHLIYARLIGESNIEIYNRSQQIINGNRDAMFGEAYNLSYTDVYDFCSKKQSLKKWEIELGIHHHELGLPWDQEVPEDMWTTVAEYCDDDVLATEAVFNARKSDFVAREILAEIAGGTTNDTTNSLTTKIIFGKERHPDLVYTDLATGDSTDGTHKDSNKFDGYEFVYSDKDKKYHNMYRGEDVGKGGNIKSYPGIYHDVALLDVESLHPHSAIEMNIFGKYTKNFKAILDARLAIKHGDYDRAKNLFDGRLAKYLDDPEQADSLAYALKIAINSVYGLTAASFDNPMRDPRNKNNIVALRGALFMQNLHDEVLARGYKIVAIKTDSIKIANATKSIVDFCIDYAKQYGYKFDFEAYYDRICQINDADYIAYYHDPITCKKRFDHIPGDNKKHGPSWTVTGAQFAVPYVFKKLFSHEDIEFKDLCVTKSVTTAMYLDMNEDLPDVTAYEAELATREWNDKHGDSKPKRLRFPELSVDQLMERVESGHKYCFVGRVGNFCPIRKGDGGGILVREKDGRYHSVGGTLSPSKIPYRWLEAETVQATSKQASIDYSYFDRLANEAVDSIEEYGDFTAFTAIGDD